MGRYFFHDMFAVRSSDYVRDVDLYLVNDSAAWSLLTPGEKLAPELAARVIKDSHYEETGADGLVTYYSTDNSQALTDAADPVRHVIRKVTYDTSLASEAVTQVVWKSLIVLVIALPLVFLLASYLLQ